MMPITFEKKRGTFPSNGLGLRAAPNQAKSPGGAPRNGFKHSPALNQAYKPEQPAQLPKSNSQKHIGVSRIALRPESSHGKRLIGEMVPLVRRVAMRLLRRLPPHIELDDLVGAGYVGLLDAFGRFDARKNVVFASYASHRIRGAMLDELRKMDHAPRLMRKTTKIVEEARWNLELRLGRAVSDSELARELGMTIDKWHQTNWRLEAIRVSLSPPPAAAAEEGFPLEPFVDSNPDPFEQCYRSEILHIVRCAYATLSKRQQFILKQYYEYSVGLKEIGTALGVSESRASQLRSQAIARVRRIVSRGLEGRALGHRRTEEATGATKGRPVAAQSVAAVLAATMCLRAASPAGEEQSPAS